MERMDYTVEEVREPGSSRVMLRRHRTTAPTESVRHPDRDPGVPSASEPDETQGAEEPTPA